LKAGTIKILSNVEVYTEGLDVPSVGAVILLRPTRSLGLYLQMIGRGRRVCDEYEEVVILDHCGLYADHCMPNDSHDWSLTQERKAVRNASEGERLRHCPECSA